PSGARARISQRVVGGAFQRTPGNMPAWAVVLTLTLTIAGDPGITVTLPAGPLQAALGGAPSQLTLTLSGPPLAASWSWEVDVCPALIVSVLPAGVLMDRSAAVGGGGGPAIVTCTPLDILLVSMGLPTAFT